MRTVKIGSEQLATVSQKDKDGNIQVNIYSGIKPGSTETGELKETLVLSNRAALELIEVLAATAKWL